MREPSQSRRLYLRRNRSRVLQRGPHQVPEQPDVDDWAYTQPLQSRYPTINHERFVDIQTEAPRLPI